MSEQQDLAALRVARQALNEGLIAPADYDVVKVAFLKAQQIKTGLDAGFIKPADYDKAREAFLRALDFQVMTTLPQLSAGDAPQQPQHTPLPPVAAPAPAFRPSMRNSSIENGTFSANTPTDSPTAVAAAAAQYNSQQDLPAAYTTSMPSYAQAAPTPSPLSGPPSSAAPAYNRASSMAAALGEARSSGISAMPADIPKYAKGITAGKMSMAGISVDEDCINLFTHMKTRSAYKWVTFRIDDTGTKVVIDQLGTKTSSYSDFISTLPDNQCRYGVYDYAYISPERGNFSKLVFLHWAPDSSAIKSKMMYASTKDFFKGFLDGVGAELQATEPADLTEDEMRGRVSSNMTRK